MNISGMEKLTLTDYPGKLACIVFTQGCNFKCPFCQNADLIECNFDNCPIKDEEVFKYLEKRKNILDGIVVSGGEPLLQPNLKKFLQRVKEFGLKVKLDTNGTNPNKLKELIDEQLIDYVAMDVKNDISGYSKTIGLKNYALNKIRLSVDILKSSNIDFEFRTTMVKELHKYEDIRNICNYLGDNVKYYLQNFEDSERVLTKGLHGFSEEELKAIGQKLNQMFPNVMIRGI